MAVYLLDVRLHAGNQFLCFVGVELEDTSHFYLHQFEDILFGHLTDKCGIIRCQAFVDMLAGCIHVFGLLKFLIFIDTLFDEYLLQ